MAGDGRLVSISGSSAAPEARNGTALSPHLMSYYGDNVKHLVKDVLRHRAFRNMVRPLRDRSPRTLVKRVKNIVDKPKTRTSVAPRVRPRSQAFMRPFFAEDRLVSSDKIRTEYPHFRFTKIADTTETLARYFSYRFTDEPFI